MSNVRTPIVNKANVYGETRLDSAFAAVALSATAQLVYTDVQFIEYTSTDAAYKVILPEADSGNLKVGWRSRIRVGDASAESVTVQTYDDTTPVDIKTIAPGFMYEFVCTSVSTPAGSWQVNIILEDDQLEAERYVGSFNATTDWALDGDLYTHTVSAATHGIQTSSPTTHVSEGASAPFTRVVVGESIDGSGNFEISVAADPDNRFAGVAVIM